MNIAGGDGSARTLWSGGELMRETLFETRFCFSVLCVLSRRGTRLHARLRQVKVSWVRDLGVLCQSVTEFFQFQTRL